GAFNSSITRATKRKVAELRNAGKEVKIFCVGKKAYDLLKHDFGSMIVGRLSEIGRKQVSYHDAEIIVRDVLKTFETEHVYVVHIVFNRFRSAISQVVTFQQIIPLVTEEKPTDKASAPYDFEPEEEVIMADLLPRNI